MRALLALAVVGLGIATTEASAQEAPDYPSPNTLLWASVGTPWLASVRGEAWLADEVTGELGVGGFGDDTLGLDWAIRWRPEFLCFGCGGSDLLTIGIGPGGLVAPPVDRDDWGVAVGGDLGIAYVHWLSKQTGLTVAGRGGAGAAFVDADIQGAGFGWWGFGGVGLAF
jgi:hypothetical protein